MNLMSGKLCLLPCLGSLLITFRLWKLADPTLVVVLLLCSASLLAHEVKLLSSVALLYLQSLILAATTVSSLVLWARCFQEESRSVKGVLMGCNVLMWGLALFGFIRAVVIWKVEANEYEMDQERAVMYGTFLPWGEGDDRRESLRGERFPGHGYSTML